MKYRAFIERYFLIDEPKSGRLVPFKFRPVQAKYYEELVRDYDIEKQGLTNPVRDVILKARREGFSSLILALFAADDVLSENPTETLVVSYKDDATKVFRKRYRNFLLSYAAQKRGFHPEILAQDPTLLEQQAKWFLSVDSDEYEIRHNRAHFYCGTASARTGGRGGVVQKLLFSEAAHYPDKKELRASEIVEATMQQVDKGSGWVYIESTANGYGNYYAKLWEQASNGQSRFKPRFYGWQEFYTEEQFELIKREMTDKRLIPQEYPATPEEAFLSSGDKFFDPEAFKQFVTKEGRKMGNWTYYADFIPGHRYALAADVSEGVGRHNSAVAIIDFDASVEINGMRVKKPDIVATYVNNRISPDLFAHEIKAGGIQYGSCIAAPERNNHGFATIAVLKTVYPNIYREERSKLYMEERTDKLGWHTNMATKPRMLHDLRTAINEGLLNVPSDAIIKELVAYPAQDLNEYNVDEEDETGGHFDLVIALAIAWQMRNVAGPSRDLKKEFEREKMEEQDFDKHSLFNEI